jgi:hypothetical protein
MRVMAVRVRDKTMLYCRFVHRIKAEQIVIIGFIKKKK